MKARDRTARTPGAIRLGRFAGVLVQIRPSLLLMGVALVLLFAPRFAGSAQNSYLVSTAFVVGLYVSVLVHELAHVVAARHFGMAVSSVTLHLLGGETVMEGESRTPWQELLTSIVGPVTSLVIGLAGLWSSTLFDGGVTDEIVWSIGFVNVLVAIFNMLPGLPLDGGRVFRAIVWHFSGNEATGIRAAAWFGRISAVAIVAVVLVLVDWDDERTIIDLVIALLVGWFLWQGAGDALRHADRFARVNQLVARELGELGVDVPLDSPRLPVGLRGTSLLRAMAAEPAHVYVLVDDADQQVAVLRASRVDEAYREGIV